MGVGKETVEKILQAEYKEEMNLGDAIKLAVKSLVKALETRGEQPRIKIAVVPAATKKLKMLTEGEIEAYRRSIEGSGAQ